MFSLYVLGFLSILLFLFFYGLYLLTQRKYKKGSIITGIPVSIVIGLVVLFYWAFYESDPSALQLKMEKEGDHYVIQGDWKTRLENYRFGTDFLVFYVPEDIPVELIRYKKGDWKPDYWNFDEDVVRAIEQNTKVPQGLTPQLFDIQVEESFEFGFQLPSNVQMGDVQIHYVHVYAPPMDAFTYWSKRIE